MSPTKTKYSHAKQVALKG